MTEDLMYVLRTLKVGLSAEGGGGGEANVCTVRSVQT